ncbi:MAG: GYF domain-containing protein [Myxococcales bacterium]
MKFSCGNCHAQYMISDEKVGGAGVRVRCKKCGNVIHVKHLEAEAPPPEDATVVMTADKIAAIQGQIDAARGPPEGPPKVTADEIGQAFDSMFAEHTDEASHVDGPAVAASLGPPLASLDDPDRAETRVLDAGDMRRLATVPAPSPTASAGDFDSEATVAAPMPRPPSRPPEQVEWFVAIRDEQVGPLTGEGVKERWDQGEVGPDTLVWCTGLPDWKPLSTVDELAQLVAPAPAAAPRNGSSAPEAPARGSPSRAPAPPSPDLQREDSLGGFKPSAASALASLASMAQEEMEAADRAKSQAPPEPERQPAAQAAAAVARSPSRLDLFADLPPEDAKSQASPASSFGLPPQQAEDYRAPPRQASSFGRPDFGGGSTVKVIAVVTGSVVTLLVVLGVLFWALYLKPQRDAEERRLAEIAAKLEAAKKVAAVPAPTPAPVPTPVPAVPAAPKPAVAATPPPKAAPAPSAPIPDERGSRHHGGGKRHGGHGEEVAAASNPAPASPSKPAQPAGGGEDFLAGGGGSNIDKEFARELDGQGDSAPAQKSTHHDVYIPPPPGQSDVPDSLGQSDIMQVIVDHKGSFARCKSQNPGGSGTIVMHWRIRADGRTADIKKTSGDLDNPPLASCLTKQIGKLRFPQSRGSTPPVDFPFNF